MTAATTPSSATQPSFSKVLERDDFTADIKSGASQMLVLTARRGGREIAVIRDSVAGETTEALLTDLNQNELPEVLIIVRGKGDNPRGKVVGYEFAGQSYERFQLPVLSTEATVGYMGHDQFRVADNYLMRTFPVYLPNDSPTLSTGGQRTIRYTLDHTLRLTEFHTIDHP